MSYRVAFTPYPANYFHHMPRGGRDAFFARPAALAAGPWDDVTLAAPESSDAVRSTTFGEYGIVYLFVDEETRTVFFFELVWAA